MVSCPAGRRHQRPPDGHGGFGHCRLRDFILGGVTQQVLTWTWLSRLTMSGRSLSAGTICAQSSRRENIRTHPPLARSSATRPQPKLGSSGTMVRAAWNTRQLSAANW